MTMIWQKGQFSISTERSKLQLDEIYAYLSRSYWAAERPKEVVQHSIENSLCFGLFEHERQIGFARVITDYAVLAHICDVYVLEAYQHKGLGKWLLSVVMSHPDLQEITKWSLATRDAHGFYRQFGFRELKKPEMQMEYIRPTIQVDW